METKFNFNSQVCTDKNQSERLLALGLKKETADMGWVKLLDGDGYVMAIAEDYSFIDIPAWSLGRLLEVMRTKALSQIIPLDNTFDILIEIIEIRIKEGHFNKKYLV